MFFVVFLLESENKTINPSGGTWKIGFVWFASFENSIKQHETLFYSISSYWSIWMLVWRLPLQLYLNRRNTFLFRDRVCGDFTYKGHISCIQISHAEGNEIVLPLKLSIIPPPCTAYMCVNYKKGWWAAHNWEDEYLGYQRKIIQIKDTWTRLPCFYTRLPVIKPMLERVQNWKTRVLGPRKLESTIKMETPSLWEVIWVGLIAQ